MIRHAFLALAIAVLGAVPGSQGVGSTLPDLELVRFRQTDARSLDDFYGEVLLLEFFAYW